MIGKLLQIPKNVRFCHTILRNTSEDVGHSGEYLPWEVIHYLIKNITGGKFDSVGINITVEHISSGMRIISNEYSFGDMVLQLVFSISRGSHIDIK